MSQPPNPPTGGFDPWAPRPGGSSGPGTAGPSGPTGGAWNPGSPGPGGGGWNPGASGPAGGPAAPGRWAPPSGAAPASGAVPTPGAWGAPRPGDTAPWAPAAWGNQPAAGGPPVAQPGAGSPPPPPGYGAGPPAAGRGPVPPSPAAAPSSEERGGRLLAALVGGIVGAVVAALVASGLVLATSDDDGTTATSPNTTTGSGSIAGNCDSADIQHILEIAQPSVVSINTEFEAQPGAVGAGSGFVYDAEEGLILTNAHVIEGASEISVTFFDGSAMGAELEGAFVDDDVAMLRVEDVEGMVAAQLGSSDALQVGEDVVAIGNALGLGGKPTVTTGIVSAKDRSISGEGVTLTNLIQTDAAINPGNSGGPLLNCRGEVVGINTAKIVDASNIGFALAIDNLRPLIDELENGNGEVNADQAFLGVSTVALADGQLPQAVLDQYGITDLDGLIVTQITAGSAADEAGLQEGDVILEADGQVTDSNDVLGEVIRAHEPGDTITLSIERGGDPMEITATLKRRGG